MFRSPNSLISFRANTTGTFVPMHGPRTAISAGMFCLELRAMDYHVKVGDFGRFSIMINTESGSYVLSDVKNMTKNSLSLIGDFHYINTFLQSPYLLY